MVEQKFKYIIRIANTDLDGNKPVFHALRKIKGVSFMFSNAILKRTNIDFNKKAGFLTDQEKNELEKIIKDPKELPNWILNRRKDYETGKNIHLSSINIKLVQDKDVKRLQKVKSYRGIRHALGLPLRGQRTRAHFRKGRAIGVQKKAAKMAKASGKEKTEKGKK